MPFLSRLATAFSPPGSLANSRRARRSASFSAVVWRAGSVTTCLPHVSGCRSALNFVKRAGHVFAHLSDDRLVDGLDVLATDRHDLEVGNVLAPATVRLANGVPRLEHDRVVMVAIGHVEGDMPGGGVELDGVDRPVVRRGRALGFDEPGRDLHTALADCFQHKPD